MNCVFYQDGLSLTLARDTLYHPLALHLKQVSEGELETSGSMQSSVFEVASGELGTERDERGGESAGHRSLARCTT